MKKLFIAIIAVCTLTATAIASDGGKKVNHTVLQTFKKAFSDATNVSWTVTEHFAKASFLLDEERVEAYYTLTGEFIAESKAIPTHELPRAAKKALTKKYDNYTIKEVIEYATAEKLEYYISLENEKETRVLKVSTRGDIETFKTVQK